MHFILIIWKPSKQKNLIIFVKCTLHLIFIKHILLSVMNI